MADYDSNIIKPVDNLNNITGLSPARRREERSRRQQLNKDNEEQDKQQPNGSLDEQVPEDAGEKWDVNGNGPDGNKIDYRA